jgi:hypothetical protein
MRERGNKKREKLFVRGDEETFFFFDFSIFCSSFFLNIFVKNSQVLLSLPSQTLSNRFMKCIVNLFFYVFCLV